MTHALIIALSVMGSSDALSKQTFDGLTISVPSGWKAGEDNGSKTWEDPAGEDSKHAMLELNVWPMEALGAQECVDHVRQKLEGDSAPKLPDGGVGAPSVHFDKLKVGGQPAIRQVTFDYVGQGDAAKTEANKVSTVMYIGCNGTTKFLLSMTSPASKSPRYGTLLKKIVESISYAGK